MRSMKEVSYVVRAWAALIWGALLVLALTIPQTVKAQDDATAPSAGSVSTAAGEPQTSTGSVPRLIKFSGVVNGVDGKPASGTVALTFTLYNGQEDGVALWMETQTVQLDSEGHYNVLLGAESAAGLPLDLFSSGNALWLGVQPGLPGAGEEPRVLLVAVPYALKAVDADTLGGKPASAYVLSQVSTAASSGPPANGGLAAASKDAQPQRPGPQAETSKAGTNPGVGSAVTGSGTLNFIPVWTGNQSLGNSLLFQLNGNVGVGTQSPGAKVDAFTTGTAVRGTSNSPNFPAVVGLDTASSGRGGNGIEGQTFSPGASGVVGYNKATTGTAYAVYGDSYSTGGFGVGGYDYNPNGYTTGVQGGVYSPNGTGVSGVSNASTGGTGVAGVATAASGTTTGVYGQASSSDGFGVYGAATATSGGPYGVYGSSASSGGAAIKGSASATSGATAGVDGENFSTSGVAVAGYELATSGSTAGVIGQVLSPSGVAGIFDNVPGQGLILQGLSGSNYAQVFSVDGSGNLDISGNLTVAGSKSARVKLQDGRDVALYAVESPENWFEDFGTGQLRGGTAEVALDPEFLQTVDTAADYHVFLTPNGDCHGLYVASKTASGFEVRELGSGTATVAFDYRIVARRRGFENVRLQEVHLPQASPEMKARVASVHAIRPVTLPPAPRIPVVAAPAVPAQREP